MGIGRGDDLRLHEVNVACLFWSFFTIVTELKGVNTAFTSQTRKQVRYLPCLALI